MTRCVHHWILNDDDIGLCRLCGRVTDFRMLQHLDPGYYKLMGDKKQAVRPIYMRTGVIGTTASSKLWEPK